MANYEIDWEADIDIGMGPGAYFVQPTTQFSGLGFEIEEGAEFIMEMGSGVYVAVANRIFIPQGMEIGDAELGFEMGGGPYRAIHPAGLINPLFGRGVEIRLSARLPVPDDAAFEIFLEDETILSFPGNRLMTEILYPVIPANEINKVLTRMDSKEWRAANKTATPVVRSAARPLRFRVDRPYMATFEGDLDAVRGQEFRLQTPGYRIFGHASEDNWVRLVTYSQPQREDGGLTYLVDVYFRYIRNYP